MNNTPEKNITQYPYDVTFTLTSCGRPDLLEKTIDSFIKFNTYPIKKYIITEDSGIKNVNNHLIQKYKHLNILWIENQTNLGQLHSIDFMYNMVNTDYIFHCEDDWEFTNYSFIEKSFEILINYDNILQVWLRDHNDTNGHPTIYFNENFDLLSINFLNVWNGFSFNPGLRRLKDYKLINNYKQFINESNISIEYGKLNFRAAILKSKYVQHIGWGRHIN